METPDELTAFLATATVDGILGRLLYRGAAWSLMREAGVLPQTAPPLGATIETDLAEHGFALLRGAMALRAQTGASDLTNKAFERAANAFEALVRNGDPEAPDRGFRRTIAAAAYHLAGFSAVAYSLFNETDEDLNASPGETAIRHLILRDLDQLRAFVRDWLGDEAHGDEQMGEALGGDEPDIDDILSTILNTTICRALAYFDFALETGEEDAVDRRIVCLSAILPSGDELDDLTAWIRSDEPGEPVRSDWRPTRQRFGALTWRGKDALLRLDLDDGGPFLDKFVEEKPARGREKNPYPRKNSHLALFAAWEFAGQGKRTLIFSTQANWVESYGKQVVDLCKRGYLESLLEDEGSIARALEVGKEWLGEDHPAVASLKAGVAIHHGRLPSPFLRELEVLLSEGVLKVIVASPTLSQGLNLNAAVLLVPALYRAGEKIKGEEFANVAGRAGRAFVDVEGLIVHVMFDKTDWRKKEWRKLVASAKARTLKSGLIQIVAEILERLSREGVLDRDDAWEYLANSREAWRSPDEEAELAERLAAAVEYDGGDESDDEDESEDDEEETIDEEPLSQIVERLDATVFGLIEALDADRADLPKLLDEALKGSLWARQIAREEEDVASLHKKVFEARADLIWKTTTEQARRGHFAMGVGLEAGLSIDAMADVLADLVDRADGAALSGEVDELADALGGLAERLLFMRPFIPDKRNALPANWKAILRAWVSGEDVSKIGPQNMRVVEEAFTYRLVWALEAIRTRRMSLGWSPETVAGGAAATVETGVPQFMMAMLIRAGLPSRTAAMASINETKPMFVTPAEMRAWLESDEITAFTDLGDWPTPETAALWARFRTEALSGGIQKWSIYRNRRLLDVPVESAPRAGLYRIITDEGDGRTWLTTPDYQRLAAFRKHAVDPKPSLLSGRLPDGVNLVDVLRVGRGKMRWPPANA